MMMTTTAAVMTTTMSSSSPSSSDEELIQVIDEMSKYIQGESSSSSSSSSAIKSRSRHGSSNSSKSSVDSAIGDVRTPKSDYEEHPEPTLEEVEVVCGDLLRRFRFASDKYPRKLREAREVVFSEDPLFTTVSLLKNSLARMRGFLFSLDPMRWLPPGDRLALYNSHVCAVSILRASIGFDPESAPPAYPLPYGEYLGEIEALHLILAHDLYNELRSLLAHIQEPEIKDLRVMLLVMMIAFFTPTAASSSPSALLPHHYYFKVRLSQPEKVIKVHDYYTHKLQAYLTFRYGPEACPRIMNAVISMIEKVRNFSERLREFLCDVTRCGLQKQYESVCENIGLMAFLLQSEPA